MVEVLLTMVSICMYYSSSVSTSSILSNVHETINVYHQLAQKLQTGFAPGMDNTEPACVMALLELNG